MASNLSPAVRLLAVGSASIQQAADDELPSFSAFCRPTLSCGRSLDLSKHPPGGSSSQGDLAWLPSAASFSAPWDLRHFGLSCLERQTISMVPPPHSLYSNPED